MSENSFHLRITPQQNQADSIIAQFIDKFKPIKYIVSEEVSKEGVYHLHAHLEYKDVPKRQTLSDFFKRMDKTTYYHKNVTKDNDSNILYVIKDLKIKIYNGFTQEELNEYKQQTEEINEDKKKDVRKKILDAYRKKLIDEDAKKEEMDELQISELDKKFHDKYLTLRYICQFICELYIHEWDKEPPLNRLKAYALYVAEKISREGKYTIYTNLYYESIIF